MCEYGVGRGRKVKIQQNLVQLYWSPYTAGHLLKNGVFIYRLLRPCWFILVWERHSALAKMSCGALGWDNGMFSLKVMQPRLQCVLDPEWNHF